MTDEEEDKPRVLPPITAQEKWTLAYQEGRRVGREDALASGRIQTLENRMDNLERHFNEQLLPQLTDMGRALSALVDETKANRTSWQKWSDRGKLVLTFLYRSSIFLMFVEISAKNSKR